MDGVENQGELALYAAGVVAAVLLIRAVGIRLLARVLGLRTGERGLAVVRRRGGAFSFAWPPMAASMKSGIRRGRHRPRVLTREERRRLQQRPAIHVTAPRGLRSGAMLLDDPDLARGASQAFRGERDRDEDGRLLGRLAGDLKRCATGRAVVALLEEPRYAQPFPAGIIKAILKRLLEVGAGLDETLAALSACHFHPGAPVPVRRRFINLVCADSDVSWHHTSETCVPCQLVDSDLIARWVPRSWRGQHSAVFVYFDAKGRLVGWQVLGKRVNTTKPA